MKLQASVLSILESIFRLGVLRLSAGTYEVEWSLEPEPEWSRSRILHFFVGAEPE